MGCCLAYPRDLSMKPPGESQIRKAESSLELSYKPVAQLDNAFHRYSSYFYLTEAQLRASLSNLNITNLAPIFYNFFCDKEGFSTIKLSCLGVLLGSGKIPTKAQRLFRNYDVDLSGTISKSEFESMLEDMMDVSCSILPSYAGILFPENSSEIEDYKRKLESIAPSLTNYFKVVILGQSKREMSQSEFVEAFGDSEVQCLLSARTIRSLALEKENLVRKSRSHTNSTFK